MTVNVDVNVTYDMMMHQITEKERDDWDEE